MRSGVSIKVADADRGRLEAIVGNRNSPQKHVWRARIVLLTAAGLGTHAIMRETGKSKTCVWRWQERYMADGVDGLVSDKTRPPRIAPLAQAVIDRVVALTNTDPPHEATHWTAGAMAAAVDISVSSVQRIWRAHQLRPHRFRSFKLSNDPAFADKVQDVVGLYVDPPAHAVVLSRTGEIVCYLRLRMSFDTGVPDRSIVHLHCPIGRPTQRSVKEARVADDKGNAK